MVKKKIAPYFRNTGLTLYGIQAKLIQSFYLHELKNVSPGTVIHYHANIHKALKYAVKMDLIPFNPADKVERPKKQRYIADYYRQEELERLLEASKDHPYSLLIQMTAFYGLRRSAVSYTHLDVYKRQEPLGGGELKGFFPQQLCDSGRDDVCFFGVVLNLGAGGTLLIIAMNALLGFIDGDFTLDVILGRIQQIGRGIPVSYTHL